jgi:hypothetical protein
MRQAVVIPSLPVLQAVDTLDYAYEFSCAGLFNVSSKCNGLVVCLVYRECRTKFLILCQSRDAELIMNSRLCFPADSATRPTLQHQRRLMDSFKSSLEGVRVRQPKRR